MHKLNATRKTKKSNQPSNMAGLPKLDKKAILAFLKANPSLDLAKFNTFHAKQLEVLNWGKQDQATLLPQLKAMQRLVRLTHDLDTAMALYEKGLHAAVQIATIPQHKFVEQYAALFTPGNLSAAAQAKQVHRRALARKTQAVLTYTAVAQHVAPHYRSTRFDNLSALTENNYNNLPSYQDLFGNLDFCSCEDCRTILSPAAYFVDLMRLQENYISKNSEVTPPAHLLKDRRPDLWNIPLDCEHTNTLVPTLQIANKVLLRTLGQGTTYETLATTKYPFNLPFHLPLTQIRQYLKKNNQSLPAIWQNLVPNLSIDGQRALARETLQLAPQQWALYSTPVTDAKALAPLYGLKPEQDPVSVLASVDTFLAHTGLGYPQLQELLEEDLSEEEIKKGLNAKFFINVGDKQPIAIQVKETGSNILTNLTEQRLDHINRFVRLAQALNWSFIDLDWALRIIDGILHPQGGSSPEINDDALPYLAWIQTLHTQNKFSINQVCALISTIKDFGEKNGPAFFDQIFNNPSIPNPPAWKDAEGKYNLTWTVPQLGEGIIPSKSDLQIQNALTAALQISVDDLLLMANQLLQALEINDAKLPLTLQNLSIFYRLSQLPNLTGLSIRACFVALGLPGQPDKAPEKLAGSSAVEVVETLDILIQFVQWLQKTNFSVYQLQFILTGDSQDATIQNQLLGIDKIRNFLSELLTTIQPTLLTEEQFATDLTTLMQRSGASPQAIETVYNSLIAGKYIDSNFQVIKVPTDEEMKAIVDQVFPTNRPQNNPDLDEYIVQLSSDIIQLLDSYLGEKLTLDMFIAQAAPAFQKAMPLSCLVTPIWGGLRIDTPYIDPQGIITKFIEDNSTEQHKLNELIKSLLFLYIPKDLLKNIQEFITKILQNTYQLQQKTLEQQLAGLYGISPRFIFALQTWSRITLSDLISNQTLELSNPNSYIRVPLSQQFRTKSEEGRAKAQVLQVGSRDIGKSLQLLQQYAVLLQSLTLSPVDAQAMVEHPEYFGIDYNPGLDAIDPLQFTLANIQTLYQFNQLVQSFQDGENHLLDYFNLAAGAEDRKQIAQILANVTQWDAGQILFLLNKLWPTSKKSMKASIPLPEYGTVAGLSRIQAYIITALQLNLDVASLWQLTQLSLKTTDTTYQDYQELADTLWGGLQNQFQDQPSDLSSIQGNLDEAKRSALLDLVIHQLRTQQKLPITTARDLYEYLLIDVEASGMIQTSYIREAISAVQLYMYRCMNHLEPGIEVHNELYTWWSWLAQYRVWQANREVFLFPENYIQPELRIQKSPEFAQLENKLNQINLSKEDQVITAFQEYMEGFTTIASLKIIGSALYDYVDKNAQGDVNNQQKTLCLMGQTSEQPYSYYYRTAVLHPTHDNDKTRGRYIPTQWDPWHSLGLQFKPVGPLTPVYAFGKWFVFWVEQQQRDAQTNANGETTKEYAATIQFSYLNFSQMWVAPQTLVSINLANHMDITQLDSATKPYWDRVYPVFFSSINTIVVPYGKDPKAQLYYLSEGTLDQGVRMALRYTTVNRLNQGVEPLDQDVKDKQAIYQYTSAFGNKTTPGSINSASFATWFKLDTLPAEGQLAPLLGKDIAINDSGQLCLKAKDSQAVKTFPIQPSQWNHLIVGVPDKQLTKIDIQAPLYTPTCIRFNNENYLAWQSLDKKLHYGIMDDTGHIHDPQALQEFSDSVPSLAVWNNKLYIAWMVREGSLYILNYGELNGPNFKKQTLLAEKDLLASPVLAVWNNKLYIAWTGKNSLQLNYGEINETKIINQQSLPGIGTYYVPSLAVWNNKLYIAWMDYERTLHYGELNGTKQIVKDCYSYSINAQKVFDLTVWKDKLYIVWLRPGNALVELHYGELNGTGIIQNHQRLPDEFAIRGAGGVSWLTSDSSLKLLWSDQNRISLLNPSVSYLNGKLIDLFSLVGSFSNPLSLGIDGKVTFTGAFQETLLTNQIFTETEAKALYENSKRQITQDFDAVVTADKAFSSPVNKLPILSQPNGYIVDYEDATFLAWPYQNISSKAMQLVCWRLNTTAIWALSKLMMQGNIDNLLTIAAQHTDEIPFSDLGPNNAYIPPATWPADSIDFMQGAMSMYYWELFFHAPFLIAHALQTQQQFRSAQRWYEYIFNPTVAKDKWDLINQEDPNDKYWRFLGLRSQYNPILRKELSEFWKEQVQEDVKDASQLAAYHNDPFSPHAIAQLRPIAYQKTMVMHYIDNLLAWGDNLFRRYTVETLVEATMLYVVAYDLLGKQPINLGACPLPDPETLAQIAKHYGDNIGKIPEFLIQVEQSQGEVVAATVQDTPHNYIPGIYFGLPENKQFMEYWNRVRQRLYNIRHNLNIDGIYQQLPLFEPPINPMQLVAAVAVGEEVGPNLANNQVDVPYYRFNVMIAQAQTATQTVIQFGQALLNVLEKKDAEDLALLYNSNQQNLLALTRTSKQDELESAMQNVQALQASLQNAQDRLNHYTKLINENGDGYSAAEIAELALEAYSIDLQLAGQAFKGAAISGYLTPTIFGLANGGFQPGNAIIQGASIAEGSAQAVSMAGNLAATIASYQRRKEDWQLQRTLAQDDKSQAEYQILSAQYQERIANENINLLEKQIEQEQAVEEFLKNKFTRAQLYQWMIGKLSALYFQAYQLAYNMSLQAEKAWQFERGKQQTFIKPVYWDDLYYGLVAGEALQLDLQRMGKAYMDQDVRRLEIEKIISLAQLDPQALQNLKSTGTCTFDFAEQDFDYDYRGHYCRQVKNISISFPALLGPYQNVHATLTQTSNKTLLKADVEGVKYLLGKSTTRPDNTVLRVDMRANQQVALSQGINDDGLFVVNFDDPRYLPFEGTGAVSSWRLDMPKDCNPINFNSITDVIIVLQYTALVGGSSFQAAVKQNLSNFNGKQPLIMSQYSSAWYGFIQQGNPLVFKVSPALFRPNLSKYQVTGITILLVLTEAGEKIDTMPMLTLMPGQGSDQQDFKLKKNPNTRIVQASVDKLALNISNAAEWQVKIDEDKGGLMNATNVSNMIIVLEYTANFSS